MEPNQKRNMYHESSYTRAMKSWCFPLQSDKPVISALRKSTELSCEQDETREGYLTDTYVWSALQTGMFYLKSDTHIICIDTHNPTNDFTLLADTDEARQALKKVSKDWKAYERAKSTLHKNRYLARNSDNKGICRVETDLFTSEKPADMQFVRVVVDPLRGYVDESSFLVGLIENLQQDYPLPCVQIPSNIPPEAPQIDEHLSARTAVMQLSVHMLDSANFYERGILEGIDVECLHQYRVALRRVRALLSLLKEVFPAEEVLTWRNEISDIMKGTNQLRDLDVQIEDLNTYVPSIPEEYKRAFQTIIERSKEARRREYIQVTQFLQSSEYTSRIETVRGEIENAASLPPTELSVLPIKRVVSSILQAHYRKIKKKIKKLTGHEDYSLIHKVRIEGKKLRYLCEFFSSLYPESSIKPVIKQLKLVQTALGDYNDVCTQREFFQAHAHHAREHNEIDIALAVGGITTIIDQKSEDLKSKALDRIRLFIKNSTKALSSISDFQNGKALRAQLRQEEKDENTGLL
jgi:CHAD domain-containing protein